MRPGRCDRPRVTMRVPPPPALSASVSRRHSAPGVLTPARPRGQSPPAAASSGAGAVHRPRRGAPDRRLPVFRVHISVEPGPGTPAPPAPRHHREAAGPPSPPRPFVVRRDYEWLQARREGARGAGPGRGLRGRVGGRNPAEPPRLPGHVGKLLPPPIGRHRGCLGARRAPIGRDRRRSRSE